MLKDYFRLFWIFFRVGAFTFGGGYAMIPIIQKEIVEKAQLIDDDEFLDIIAVAQSLPGAVAVNTAVFVGYKLLGFIGALFTLVGTALPSLIVIIILAIFYNEIKDIHSIQLFFRGVRPAIVSLIFMAAVKLSKSISKKTFNYLVILGSFTLIVFLQVHPIYVVIICGLLGLTQQRKENKNELS
ncbi:Chromate transporter [Alkaliphilus metalliredigens QYMF]|uniref:Chromate transporter n=1 Tax=Alkaliphilus metalliredigens (strain QYMF) TaxID=293826 RepID=A6TM64_ALKMQ|nr:chromate transporter [Alkaliphilus metalliredigens]ABR47282.1 Chromate transporter [Alkaliphilus metalliredigens QYMF]